MNNYEIRKLSGLVEEINLRSKKGFDSENLFNEMAVLGGGLLNKLEAGLQWIKNNQIQAVIVGGTAVVHYVSGARDLTPDIDFLVADFNHLLSKVKEEGLAHSPLAERQVTRFGGGNIGIQVEEFDADFLNPRSGNPAINDYILRTAVPGRVGGGTFPIASPEALAILKFDMGRDKDDGDAFLLLQSGQVNKQKYLAAVEHLKGSLSDPESLKTYAEMI